MHEAEKAAAITGRFAATPGHENGWMQNELSILIELSVPKNKVEFVLHLVLNFIK
jgi:hypothetical protein